MRQPSDRARRVLGIIDREDEENTLVPLQLQDLIEQIKGGSAYTEAVMRARAGVRACTDTCKLRPRTKLRYEDGNEAGLLARPGEHLQQYAIDVLALIDGMRRRFDQDMRLSRIPAQGRLLEAGILAAHDLSLPQSLEQERERLIIDYIAQKLFEDIALNSSRSLIARIGGDLADFGTEVRGRKVRVKYCEYSSGPNIHPGQIRSEVREDIRLSGLQLEESDSASLNPVGNAALLEIVLKKLGLQEDAITLLTLNPQDSARKIDERVDEMNLNDVARDMNDEDPEIAW